MKSNDFFSTEKWDFRSDSILAGLSATDLNLLMGHKTERVYRKAETIYREGAYPVGIFFIARGKIKKYKVDERGREQIIQVVNSGDLMGYHAVLSEEHYPVSAAALEESLVAFITREDFLKTLWQSEELNRKLLKNLSTEFAVFANSVSLFMRNSVRERLALRLVLLHEKYKIGLQPGQAVEINMSRDDLASLIGAARENIVRELMDLKQADIILTNGRKIIVKDLEKLIAIFNHQS